MNHQKGHIGDTPRVAKLLKLHRLTNQFRGVRRTTKVVDEDRYENDSEHSYQLAMLAWYLIETDAIPLNKELVLKYCLVHDLPEVYAGDVDPWSSSEADKNAKEEREAFGAKQIATDYGEFNELLNLLHAYHERKDEESKFVYALDKIQPVVNIYLDGGDFYRMHGVTIEQWVKHNSDEIAHSRFVVPYFQDLSSFLNKTTGLFYRG